MFVRTADRRLHTRPLSFAGRTLTLTWDDEAATPFLDLLFTDLEREEAEPAGDLRLERMMGTSYRLADGDSCLHSGPLDVTMAAQLYDAVIFRLLAEQAGGLALHAGAVIRHGRLVLLPGQSGSGKSTLTAWLCGQGSGYLTDELVFFPADKAHLLAFTRPLCIKHGAAGVIRGLLPEGRTPPLEDTQGLILPHRHLNSAFTPLWAAPALILFPAYAPDACLQVEPLSPARASGLLMGCNVNGRNLAGHGFPQVARIARAAPARRLVYSGFDGLLDVLDDLLSTLPCP